MRPPMVVGREVVKTELWSFPVPVFSRQSIKSRATFVMLSETSKSAVLGLHYPTDMLVFPLASSGSNCHHISLMMLFSKTLEYLSSGHDFPSS